jgi:hypothetical protein
MAISAASRNCLNSVVKLSDDEAAQVIDRMGEVKAANSTLSDDQALKIAVQQLIAELKGAATPSAGTAVNDMAATLAGVDNDRKAAAEKITKEASDNFMSRITAARDAGEITPAQHDSLVGAAASGDRGMKRAKDELLRLREEHSERKKNDEAAGKLWDDPDYNWQEGDPKWADLSPKAKSEWTKSANSGLTTVTLYDKLVAEHRVVESLPKVDDSGDISQPAEGTGGAGKPYDPTMPEAQDARSMAEWLSKNASSEWLRDIAAKIAPYVPEGIAIQYLVVGQKYALPTSVAQMIRNGAAAVALATPDGKQTIYVKSDMAYEVHALHEIIHTVTQFALHGTRNPALRGELESIQVAVQRTLRLAEDPNASFFARVVNDADELLAYAFSSPVLREWMRNMNADGTMKGLKEAYAADNLAKRAERANPNPDPPTLWQRFVDWVLSALKLEKFFAPKIDAAMKAAEEARLKYITEETTPDLYDRLDALFQKTLDAQASQPKHVDGFQEAAAAPSQPQQGTAAPKRQKSPEPTNVADLPEFEAGRFTQLKDWMGGWRNKPGMLGWLSLRQIADRFKDVPGVKEFAELSSRMGAKAKTLMAEAHAVDQDWAQLKADEAIELQKLMLESTMEQVWIDRPLTAEANHEAREKPGMTAKHAALAKRYQALGDTAKRVYQNVQAKMRKDWDERGRLLRQRITDQYRAELPGMDLDALALVPKRDRAEAVKGLTRNQVKSLISLWGDLDTHAERLSQMQGPYFPLVRFGEHVVVAKSAEYNVAAEAFSDARDELAALNESDDATDEALSKAREKVKATQKVMEDLKDNERHYVVEFFESPTEAKQRERQLAQFFAGKGRPMQVYSERRVEHFQRMDSVSPAFMKKLEDALASNLPDKDATAIRAAVRDLYIQSMPERSALKSQLRRLNVKGVKATEMRRSFAAASMRASWHLSRLEFGDAMQKQLLEIRTGEGDDQRVVGAELAKRLVSAFQQDTPSLLMERLSNLSYLTYLGLSPSFFIMNAAQPWVISLPIMAAKFGIKRATAELGTAFTDVAAAMKASAQDQKTWRFELNLEEFKDEGERAMLSELFNKGIIDVTIEHDLGSLASGQETTAFGKVMQFATLPAHHTEVVNRVMTALAAYRLAMAGDLGTKASAADATAYAEQVVADTHLDYTPENAPRFMRTAALGGLGRVVFQFKKYMQGMIFLTAKLAVDAARGDKEAGKGLAYLMGGQLAVAGSVGIPLAAPVGLLLTAIAKMWPDDDEPEIAQLMYNGIKDAIGETAARALVKGLPAAAGIDVSGRIGMGQILNPLAYTQQGKDGRDWVAASLLALAGPAASMLANWAEALHIAKDDPVKAAQTALPKVLADPIRAMDRYNRGVTSKRGAELIGPDEFGALGLVMRGLGFELTDVTDMYQQRGAFTEMKQNRDEARKRLIAQYAAARKNGDTTSVAEDVQEFNSRHPDNRITAASLQAAVKARKKAAEETRGGIQVRKQDRSIAEELGVQR